MNTYKNPKETYEQEPEATSLIIEELNDDILKFPQLKELKIESGYF